MCICKTKYHCALVTWLNKKSLGLNSQPFKCSLCFTALVKHGLLSTGTLDSALNQLRCNPQIAHAAEWEKKPSRRFHFKVTELVLIQQNTLHLTLAKNYFLNTEASMHTILSIGHSMGIVQDTTSLKEHLFSKNCINTPSATPLHPLRSIHQALNCFLHWSRNHTEYCQCKNKSS